MDPVIKSLRQQIDRLNIEILELLSRRASVVAQIGQRRAETGVSQHYDPKREEEMLKELEAVNAGPFPADAIRALFKEIFKASLEIGERQSKAKLLSNRQRNPQGTAVMVGDMKIGDGTPIVIAGPCSVESWEQLEEIATMLVKNGVKLMRAGAYKPRTSPYAFQGLGEEGLEIGRKIADKFGLYFVTEVMDTRDVELVAKYADLVQVGARNAQNFSLLREVGSTKKPVLLKRGFSNTVEEWLMAAEYVLAAGNSQVILCERGIRTFERSTRNTLDVSGIALVKQETHLPVIADVTHSAGRVDLLAPLARAALAVGADGVMVEVHPNPDAARSDSDQQLDFKQFEALMTAIEPFRK